MGSNRSLLLSRYLRTLSLVLALFLLLAACGSDEPEESDASDDDAAAEDDAEADDADSDDMEDEDDEEDAEAEEPAFDAEAHFSGQTIRFVTSSSAGGGADAKIRVLARYLPEYIPGNPDAQVSNQTPHVAGMNFMWASDPDGLTIGLTAAPTLEFELFEDAQWDSSEFEYLGGMDASCDSVLLVKGDTGYETIEDMAGSDDPTLIAMTSSPSPGDIEPYDLGMMLIAEYLDLPLEVRRVAETGQGAMGLAMERGEINFARYGASWCRLPDSNPGWLEDGYLVPVMDLDPGGAGQAEMPQAIIDNGAEPPHLSEVVDEEQYREFQGLVAAPRQGGSPVFLPPGTPQEIVDVLRDAFDEMVQDPEFQEQMLSAFGEGEVIYQPGADFAEMTQTNLDLLLEYAPGLEETQTRLYEKYIN